MSARVMTRCLVGVKAASFESDLLLPMDPCNHVPVIMRMWRMCVRLVGVR